MEIFYYRCFIGVVWFYRTDLGESNMPLKVRVICDVCPESPVSEEFDHIPKITEIEGADWKVLVSENKNKFTFICNTCLNWLRHSMKVLGGITSDTGEDEWLTQFTERLNSGIIQVQSGPEPQPPLDVDDGPVKSGRRVYVCRFGPQGLWKKWDLDQPLTDCDVTYDYKPDKGFNQYIAYHERQEHPDLYNRYGAHPVGNRRPIAFE